MNLQLREHVPADLDRFCALFMDAQVARHVSWLPRTRMQCEHALADAIAQQSAFAVFLCGDTSAGGRDDWQRWLHDDRCAVC